jgi:hypothetical protein
MYGRKYIPKIINMPNELIEKHTGRHQHTGEGIYNSSFINEFNISRQSFPKTKLFLEAKRLK